MKKNTLAIIIFLSLFTAILMAIFKQEVLTFLFFVSGIIMSLIYIATPSETKMLYKTLVHRDSGGWGNIGTHDVVISVIPDLLHYETDMSDLKAHTKGSSIYEELDDYYLVTISIEIT